MRNQRLALEDLHLKNDAAALPEIWPHLGSSDRALRFAARTALEKIDVKSWADKAFAEENTISKLGVILSLARVGMKEHQPEAVISLISLDYAKLDQQSRFDLLRAYTLVFTRLGPPTDAQKKAVIAQIDSAFPTRKRAENIELATLLTYLGAPNLLERAIPLMESGATQEEQLAIALALRNVETGWTPELQKRYFQWFTKAASYKGGASISNYVANIKKDAVAKLSKEDKKSLAPILNAKPKKKDPGFAVKPRSFVKNWTMEDLKPLLGPGLESGRNFKNGREAFAAANCYACHRFDQEGGAIGPDLTSAAGKFSPHDFLEQIIDPGKEISDQYGSMDFTKKDGTVINGRIANLHGDKYMIITNLYAPGEMTTLKASELKSVEPSKVSMMPPGLLNTLKDEDVLDLIAYVLSEGDPEDGVFSK